MAVLIEAIKEQQEQISSMEDDYQSQIDQLQNQLNTLESVINDCCDDKDKKSDLNLFYLFRRPESIFLISNTFFLKNLIF